MSLVSLALRATMVKAIKGRTIAGDRVSDSAVETIDALIRQKPSPIVIVSIDDGETIEPASADALTAPDKLTILIEIAVAQAIAATGADPEGVDVEVRIQESSAGQEVTLDILYRQICRALLSPAGAPWGDLWRRLMTRVVKVEKRRGGGADAGVRFASHFYMIAVEPIDDPPFGVPPDGIWADLIAAMRDTSDLPGLANVIAKEIASPSGLADWRVVEAMLGLASDTISGIGIVPPYSGDPEQPPILDSFDMGSGPVDADQAEAVDGPV